MLAPLVEATKHNHTCLHDWFPDFAGATPSYLPHMWYHMLPVPGRCGMSTGSGTEVAKNPGKVVLSALPRLLNSQSII